MKKWARKEKVLRANSASILIFLEILFFFKSAD